MKTAKLKISLKDWQEDTKSLAAFHEFAYLKITMLAVDNDYNGFVMNTNELSDILKVKLGLLNSTLSALGTEGLIEFYYDTDGNACIICNRIKRAGELRYLRSQAGKKGGSISRKGTKTLRVKFGSDIKVIKIVSPHIGTIKINGEVASVGEQAITPVPNLVEKPKKEPKVNPRTPLNAVLLTEVIEILNDITKREFTTKNATTIKNFNARYTEGFRLTDFIRVIEHKCKDWVGTEYEKYLNPETLFGNKFESYLNASPKIASGSEVKPSAMSPDQYNAYIRGDYNQE